MRSLASQTHREIDTRRILKGLPTLFKCAAACCTPDGYRFRSDYRMCELCGHIDFTSRFNELEEGPLEIVCFGCVSPTPQHL